MTSGSPMQRVRDDIVRLSHRGLDVRAASLGAATGGDLDRSARHRELRRPSGFADELRAVFVSDYGTWGAIVLLREARTADFTPAETRVLASLST
jgi:hypothetical protein